MSINIKSILSEIEAEARAFGTAALAEGKEIEATIHDFYAVHVAKKIAALPAEIEAVPGEIVKEAEALPGQVVREAEALPGEVETVAKETVAEVERVAGEIKAEL